MNPDFIRLLLRVTARISCLLFLGAFAGPGLRNLWPPKWTEWIEQSRPQFLLAFAGSHTIHLALVLTLAWAIPEEFRRQFPRYGLIGGAIVYVLIYVLAWAAFADLRSRRATRVPVRHLTALQATAMYLIWVVFALAFVGGTFRDLRTYAAFGVAVVAAFIVRLAGRRSTTQVHPTAAAAN
ncbi:MAG: hypothetical protein WAQ52_19670 [Terriglobales bacterium]